MSVENIAAHALKFLIKLVYRFNRNKAVEDDLILFLSRQSSEINLDFRMISEELDRRGSYRKVFICSRQDDSGWKFLRDNLKSVRWFARCKVCILDSYSIPVCLLKHKKEQTVIQIWHAIGKIKKSGYQTLDTTSGRSSDMARILKMHKNYDYIIAGGKAWNRAYCLSFNTTEDKLLNYGLPRIDHLLASAEGNRQKVLKAYPQFADKEVLLYAPTFRKGWDLDWEPLAEAIDYSRYALVVKAHPNQKLTVDREGCYLCEEFKAIDLLSVASYLITDYSAIAVEGAALGCRTYYYIYDKEKYMANNGLNLDIEEEMPHCAFRDARQLADAIASDVYPMEEFRQYQNKFLPEDLGHATANIVDLIEERLKL